MPNSVPIATIRANGWTNNGDAPQHKNVDEGILNADDDATYTGQRRGKKTLRLTLAPLVDPGVYDEVFLRVRVRHDALSPPPAAQQHVQVRIRGVTAFVQVPTSSVWASTQIHLTAAEAQLVDWSAAEAQVRSPEVKVTYVSDRWLCTAVELHVGADGPGSVQAATAPAARSEAAGSVSASIQAAAAPRAGVQGASPARASVTAAAVARARVQAASGLRAAIQASHAPRASVVAASAPRASVPAAGGARARVEAAAAPRAAVEAAAAASGTATLGG